MWDGAADDAKIVLMCAGFNGQMLYSARVMTLAKTTGLRYNTAWNLHIYASGAVCIPLLSKEVFC